MWVFVLFCDSVKRVFMFLNYNINLVGAAAAGVIMLFLFSVLINHD